MSAATAKIDPVNRCFGFTRIGLPAAVQAAEREVTELFGYGLQVGLNK